MTASLDTDLLRAFVTVAERGSITGASQLLALTQPAVSLQIRRLEDLLGAPLFHRKRRGVQLTAAGEAFMPHARQLLALHARAIESVRETEAGRELRIGTNDVYAARHLAPVLDAFREAHPDVRPAVFCDLSTALVHRFARGELDLCLSLRHDPSSGAEVLGREPLRWVASKQLELPPTEPVPLAVYPEYCVFRARALGALASAGRPYRVTYTSQGLAAIDLAIDRGWGVAVKAASTVEPRWRVLTEADGFPELGAVEVELRCSTTDDSEALRDLRELLTERVGGALAG